MIRRNFPLSFTSFCESVSLTKLVASVVRITLTLLTNSSYVSLLTTLFFTKPFTLFESSDIVLNSSISDLTKSDFELAKSFFLANSNVSTPAALFKSIFSRN